MINKQDYELYIVKVDDTNFEVFKSLQESIFPNFYTKKFYKELLKNRSCHGYIVNYNECDIGILSYKIIPEGVYIMTFGILQDYRRKNLGKTVLCTFEAFVVTFYELKSIYLHVNVVNQQAITFYKKNGYVTLAYKKNYYKNISQKGAYLLNKTL